MAHKKVRPTESKTFLLNPHKGIATSGRFNGDPPRPSSWALPGMTPPSSEQLQEPLRYLPSTVAYFRWYWESFQPEPNRFDWSMVEEALEKAAEHGQTLQVRLMPHGVDKHGHPPEWYEQRARTVPGTRKHLPYAAPIYDSPEYVEHWGNAVREFGRRFDGHPTLESVDIAYIGPWGEGAGDCSDEAVDEMTAIYREAHTKTPLVAMVSEYKMMAAVRAGAGWRCDCFGDLRNWRNPDVPEGINEDWNHMYDRYPMAVCECGAQDAWKTAPVVFETCATPMSWHASGFDIRFIVRQGLKYHGSVFMPHSAALPEPWLDLLAKFCNDLGYRFVLRQFQSLQPVTRGGTFEYTCWIENVAAAPIYRRYAFALRMTQGQRSHVFVSEANLLEWLPGDTFLREKVQLPDCFEPGHVEIAAGLVDPETHEPRVRFAVEESDSAGWVPLDTIEVTATR